MMHGLAVCIPVLVTLLLLLPCPSHGTTASFQLDQQRSDLIAGVESNLLALFGFQRRPRPRPDGRRRLHRRSLVPPAMMHLYREQSANQQDTSTLLLPGKHTASANTVRTFTHTVSPIDGKFPMSRDRFRLSFNIDNLPAGERLTAAELQLHCRTPAAAAEDPADDDLLRQPDVSLRVDVHDIIRPGIRGQSEPILRVIDSKVVNTRLGDSVSFDVMPAVLRWLEVNQRNYGLIVEVSGLHGDNTHIPKHIRLRRDLHEDLASWLPKQPLLFTYTDDGRNVMRKVEDIVRRSKRSKNYSGLEVKKQKRKENCRRHTLHVDFADVGWNDWIVAPPGYDAYYCHGDCPFPLADHLNTTNHAIVQTLVNSVNPAAVPKACCVPTQLTSISMLYLDEENKVVLKNYQDMAVLGCGCR